jgi:hypothetical protein
MFSAKHSDKQNGLSEGKTDFKSVLKALILMINLLNCSNDV